MKSKVLATFTVTFIMRESKNKRVIKAKIAGSWPSKKGLQILRGKELPVLELPILEVDK